MQIIRFRRLWKQNWEIAFSEQHLREKLGGETAEVIMPPKPWYVRLWRRFFPLKGITFPLGAEFQWYDPKSGKWLTRLN